VRAPALVFRPGADTRSGGNPERVIERLGSSRKELVTAQLLHVISLDHDAPMVRERVLAFLRSS